MFGFSLVMVPVIFLLVFGVWLFFRRTHSDAPGFVMVAVTGLLLSAVLVPSSYSITRVVAQNMSVGGYHEYWNGWETEAVRKDRECYRDGSCVHTYQCDPYWVTETEYYTDSKGNRQSRQVQVQKWHDCPYSKQETTFVVKTTVDDVTIASNVMTGEPFRWGTRIPGGQQGAPQEWLAAKERVEANEPAPATFVKKYENYLHGTNNATFQKFGGLVQEMRDKNLLPDLVKGTSGPYSANKLYTVAGVPEGIQDRYADDVAHLNGAFGDSLQGDLHVVVVPEDIGYSQTDYIDTLLAYWQSEELGKHTLSKNALVVVLGVNDDEVVWADARTGMPVGNDSLRIQIRDEMPGLALDDKLLGKPSYDIPGETILRTDGHLESMLWGENSYQRVSMSGDDPDDNGTGFLYLKESIVPTTGQLVVAGILVSLLSAGVMLGLCAWLSNRLSSASPVSPMMYRSASGHRRFGGSHRW